MSEEHIEAKPDKNNYCTSCRKYQRLHIGGTCPTCGSKLSVFRPHKRYYTKQYIEDRDKRAKLINIERMIDKYNSDIRRLSRELNTLQLRYQQVVNLLKGIIRFQAGTRNKGKITMRNIISYIEKVVDEQPEEERDLVEEALKGDTNGIR